MSIGKMGRLRTIYVWLFLVFSTAKAANVTIEKTMQLINWGEDNLNYNELSQTVLIIGGNERLEAIPFITKNASKLFVNYNNGELHLPFAIRNTWLPIPDVITVQGNGEAFVDFPTNNYNRNISIDAATVFFTGKFLSSEKYIKFILVINYDDKLLIDGVQFDSLLTNLSNVIYDVKKYKNSITLLINRFDNTISYPRGISLISQFLLKFRNSLGIHESEKIEIIDALLKENQIALIFKPDKKGLVKRSELLSKNKKFAMMTVQNSVYIKSNNSDFNFTGIPDEVLQFLKDNLYGITKDKLLNMTEIVSRQLIDAYSWKGRRNREMLPFLDEIKITYALLLDKINPYLSRNGYEIAMHTCMDEINRILPCLVSKGDFSNNLIIFENLRQIAGLDDDIFENFNKILVDLQRRLKELLDWYSVFVESYTNAGTLSVQAKKYTTFGDLLDPTYSVYEAGINDFLNKINAAGLADSTTISNLQTVKDVDDFIIRDADAIVNLIRPNITCIDGILKVQSNFIIMSKDVIAKLCDPVNRIEILAMETLYVDADIKINDHETHVIIIADYWEIVGGIRVIDLSGIKGADFLPADDGEDGRAGNPGTPGGSIFAIVNSLNYAGGLLQFKTDGGDGGDGQNAGKGTDGSDGSDWPLESDTRMDYYNGNSNGDVGNIYPNHVTSKGYNIQQTIYRELDCDSGSWRNYGDEYSIWGKEEHKIPTDGGNGGKAGLGAENGQLEIVAVGAALSIHKSFSPGENGKEGAGGPPGRSALGNGAVMSRCIYDYDSDVSKDDRLWYDCAERCQRPKTVYSANSGSTGTAGVQKEPSKPTKLVKDIVVAEYKCMLLKTRFVRPRTEYITGYAASRQVLDAYTLDSYIFETRCINSNSGIIRDLLQESYVRPLINRLENWVGTDTEISVANHLRGALKAIPWNIRTIVPNVFIIDLGKYVLNLKRKVFLLETTAVKAAAESVSNDFAGLVNLNIPEARQYTDNFVINNLNEILNTLNAVTYEKINEIEDLLQNNKPLNGTLKELRNNVRNSFQATVFRSLGTALSVIPVVGEVASLCDELIDQMHGSSSTEIYNKFRKPAAVNYVISVIDSYLNSKMSSSEIYVDMLNYLVDSLADDSPGSIAVLLIQMKNNINDALAAAQSRRRVTTRKTMDQFAYTVKEYKKLQQLMTQTDKIEKYIVRNEMKALKLIEYEENVYNKVKPLFIEIKFDLIDYIDQSQKPFRVENWNIRKNLQELRSISTAFSEGIYNFRYNFARLDDASDMCVTQFDQIQMYEIHKEFSDYMSSLTLTPVSGTQYDSDVAYLELSMKQSIISQQVETAEASFLQKVVPLAELHQPALAGYYVLFDNSSMLDIKNNCTEKLDYINNELNFIRDYITYDDVNFEFSNFNSQAPDVAPFYSWSHSKYTREIYDIIYGKEAVFVSSVYGTPHKNCVRFSEAVLNFTTPNTTANNELTDILKRFDVQQTHIGNSMFKYVNRTFNVRSNAVPFVYSLERDASGQPVAFNQFYSMTKEGEIILSPFTSWRVKLIERQTGSFQMLQDFYTKVLGVIDLELIGKGKFVRDLATERKNLEDFYEDFTHMFPILKGYILPSEKQFNSSSVF